MNCIECGNEFICGKGKIGLQKYCSSRCREKNWVKNNPVRNNELKRKWRLKTPVICKFCKNPVALEKRGKGVQFCSNKCRVKKLKIVSKIYREKIFKFYADFKLKIGCKKCGYNKNPTCLDFHHLNPSEKERRITAGLWYFNTDLFKKEIEKCILLCKNCHYELHHPINKENGDIL